METDKSELYAAEAHRLVDHVIDSVLKKLEENYGGVLLEKQTELKGQGKTNFDVSIQWKKKTPERFK